MNQYEDINRLYKVCALIAEVDIAAGALNISPDRTAELLTAAPETVWEAFDHEAQIKPSSDHTRAMVIAHYALGADTETFALGT